MNSWRDDVMRVLLGERARGLRLAQDPECPVCLLRVDRSRPHVRHLDKFYHERCFASLTPGEKAGRDYGR
jgi:hypothetical protein